MIAIVNHQGLHMDLPVKPYERPRVRRSDIGASPLDTAVYYNLVQERWFRVGGCFNEMLTGQWHPNFSYPYARQHAIPVAAYVSIEHLEPLVPTGSDRQRIVFELID